MGKLFTAYLSARIANCMYKDARMGYEQADFRPEFSTMDHVFTAHAIIDYYISIDYSKAFDMIDRASLWMKLLNHGVHGKVLNVI